MLSQAGTETPGGAQRVLQGVRPALRNRLQGRGGIGRGGIGRGGMGRGGIGSSRIHRQ